MVGELFVKKTDCQNHDLSIITAIIVITIFNSRNKSSKLFKGYPY